MNISTHEESKGKKRIPQRGPHFTLQWHVTAKCEQDCKHCYLYESPTYESELKNELGFEECCKVIDDFSNTFDNLGMPTWISFTGGDPLTRKDIFELISYARERGIGVGILGNPNHLDYSTAKKLKEAGVTRYQVSIDGLEETHDRLRGRKGLFKDTIRAIHVLEEAGIPSVVMSTVSKENADELIEVIRRVAREVCQFLILHELSQ